MILSSVKEEMEQQRSKDYIHKVKNENMLRLDSSRDSIPINKKSRNAFNYVHNTNIIEKYYTSVRKLRGRFWRITLSV